MEMMGGGVLPHPPSKRGGLWLLLEGRLPGRRMGVGVTRPVTITPAIEETEVVGT